MDFKNRNTKSYRRLKKHQNIDLMTALGRAQPGDNSSKKGNVYTVQDYPIQTLNPQKLNSSSTDIPKTTLMKENIIPAHPFSMLLVGESGSGKTNSLIWTLNNLYKKYFERIVLIGQTCKSDGMYKNLDEKVHDDDIHTEDLAEKCSMVLKERLDEVQDAGGPEKAQRMLIILEDASSESKLMNSKAFVKLFVQLRHLGCSVVCMAHKLRIIPRLCRLNAVALCVFNCSRSDEKILIDEYCPRSCTKKGFAQLLKAVWTPDEEMQRPFLYFNRTLPESVAYRRGWSQVARLKC